MVRGCAFSGRKKTQGKYDEASNIPGHHRLFLERRSDLHLTLGFLWFEHA